MFSSFFFFFFFFFLCSWRTSFLLVFPFGSFTTGAGLVYVVGLTTGHLKCICTCWFVVLQSLNSLTTCCYDRHIHLLTEIKIANHMMWKRYSEVWGEHTFGTPRPVPCIRRNWPRGSEWRACPPALFAHNIIWNKRHWYQTNTDILMNSCYNIKVPFHVVELMFVFLLQNGQRGRGKMWRKREINHQREERAERAKNRRKSEITLTLKMWLGMKGPDLEPIVSRASNWDNVAGTSFR